MHQISGTIWPTRFARYTRLFYAFSKKIFKLFKFVVVHAYILLMFCTDTSIEVIYCVIDNRLAEIIIIAAGLEAFKHILVIGQNLLELSIQDVFLNLFNNQPGFLKSQGMPVDNIQIMISGLEYLENVINELSVLFVVHDFILTVF